MNEIIEIHPYSLAIEAAANSDTKFQWTIRRDGKVYQRSDRSFPLEEMAKKDGLRMVERLLSDHGGVRN